MKPSSDIEADFRRDFQALLDKYNAEFEIRDFWQGYAECGQDIKCMVSIHAVFNDDLECVSDNCEFNLGTYHHGT
jgi:hypothetical protein